MVSTGVSTLFLEDTVGVSRRRVLLWYSYGTAAKINPGLISFEQDISACHEQLLSHVVANLFRLCGTAVSGGFQTHGTIQTQ